MGAQSAVCAAGLAFAKEDGQIGVDLNQGDGGFKSGVGQKGLGDGGEGFIDGHSAQLVPQGPRGDVVVASIEQLAPMRTIGQSKNHAELAQHGSIEIDRHGLGAT